MAKLASAQQRRRYERFPAEVPVRIVVPGASSKSAPRFEATLMTRDLSFGGAFIASAFQFKDEPTVLVELKLPDETLHLKGKVVRKTDGGMGIQFDEMKPKAREAVLRHFVPPDHRAFHKDLIKGGGTDIPVEKLSLVLHAWEEWRLR